MALKRSAIQPVGTSPAYAKTSGKNAYSAYGTTTRENKGQGGQAAAQYGILGAMAAKSGYDWADKNGYIDKAKEKLFGPQEGSSYFAPGGAGDGNGPNGMQPSGPWGNAEGHFSEGAAGTGFGNAGMSSNIANGGQFSMNAGSDYLNAGLQASQAAQAAQTGAQSSEELAQLVASLYA